MTIILGKSEGRKRESHFIFASLTIWADSADMQNHTWTPLSSSPVDPVFVYSPFLVKSTHLFEFQKNSVLKYQLFQKWWYVQNPWKPTNSSFLLKGGGHLLL